jgi:hypothetical protein
MYNFFIGCSEKAFFYANIVQEIIEENPMLRVIPWWKPGIFRVGDHVLNQLLNGLHEIDYALLIGTPDDLKRRRGQITRSMSENVILEYGLFCGLLGHQHVALFQIGNIPPPSDIEGLIVVKAPSVGWVMRWGRGRSYMRQMLRPYIERCVDDLLQLRRPETDISLLEFRSLVGASSSEQITPLVCASISRRMKNISSFGRIGRLELQGILDKYSKNSPQLVGSEGHTSMVSHFVQIDLMSPEDVEMLSDAFVQFVARHVQIPANGHSCASRLIIEQKRVGRDQKFLAKVVEKLGMRPAIVNPDFTRKSRNVYGRAIKGEAGIFVHDFTESGFRPRRCIGLMREFGVVADTLVTFLVRRPQLEMIEESCDAEGIGLRAFCIRNDDGSLELTGN